MYFNVESIDNNATFIENTSESDKMSKSENVKKQYYKLDMKHVRDNQDNQENNDNKTSKENQS